MSQEWYYSVEGGRQGPVAAAELKKLAEAGTLKPDDLVWKDGMTDWAAARSIKGLFAAAAAGPAGKSGEAKAARVRDAEVVEEDDRPSARGRRRDEDEDDRPSRRGRDEDDERPSGRVRRRDEDEDDRPSRRGRDDEAAAEDRPRKRKRSRVPEETSSQKMVAGILGILLGGLAIHKFYLGFTGTAVIQLLVSIFTCGLAGWLGIIEGIIYLTKSDEDFYRDYIVDQKQWF